MFLPLIPPIFFLPRSPCAGGLLHVPLPVVPGLHGVDAVRSRRIGLGSVSLLADGGAAAGAPGRCCSGALILAAQPLASLDEDMVRGASGTVVVPRETEGVGGVRESTSGRGRKRGVVCVRAEGRKDSLLSYRVASELETPWRAACNSAVRPARFERDTEEATSNTGEAACVRNGCCSFR